MMTPTAGIVGDWNGTTGTDNGPIIRAMIADGVASISMPRGISLIKGEVRIPTTTVIDGIHFSQSRIQHQGTGWLFKVWGDGEKDLLEGLMIRGLGFAGSPTTQGLLSIADTYFASVDDCSFDYAPKAIAIELLNRLWWTEGASIRRNQVRSCGCHYKFSRTGGTDSFADTRIDSADVLNLAGERILWADAGCNIYSPTIRSKANVDISPTLAGPNAILYELGDDTAIHDGIFQLYSELQEDRPFTRFKLGKNSSISGQGFNRIARGSGMSGLLGSQAGVDVLDPSATLYEGPNGEFRMNQGGPSRIGVGQTITKEKMAPANVTEKLLYLSEGCADVTLSYTGPERNHILPLTVTTCPWAITPQERTITQLQGGSFKKFSIFGTPYWESTPKGNSILRCPLTNTVPGGVLSVTFTFRSPVNAGSDFEYGPSKPVVLFPS